MDAARELERVLAPLAARLGAVFAFEPLPADPCPEHLLLRLSPGERARAAALRVAKRRRDWTGGRLAAKAALARLLRGEGGEVPDAAAIDVAADEGRAPRVAIRGVPAPEIGVSIGHAGELAGAAAFRGTELGLDFEPCAPFDRALLALALVEHERQQVHGLDGPELVTAVLGLWTAKEAALKAARVGMALPLGEVEVHGALDARARTVRLGGGATYAVETFAAAGHVVSVAWAGAGR
ncbi:MAG: 4'-phosphopantetheinyl transferase superfamily protein [Acidobacteria bacterium]|nr:4'-phosphopantetheinyl transferase superfamily protein [Acidobacteriota bacterium]